MQRLLTSFDSYMRFTGRYGPRTRWHSGGRWHVRGRVERFVEPAVLLLLAERPTHGYELVEPVSELIPGERIDMGNLYRVLRALEEDGLVRSEWDAAEPGPAKRRYELTPQGRELLRAWVKALQQTRQVVTRFLDRYEGR
jgi:PadR family transcriptional regulator PadR